MGEEVKDTTSVATEATIKTEGSAEPKVETKPDVTPDKKVSTEPEVKKEVPTSYDLKPTEGSFIETEDLERIVAHAKAQGLSQEEAKALLVDQEKQLAVRVERQAEKWREEAQNDKEIGGAKFNESVELAKRVVDKFGSPRLKAEMTRWGHGNHPEWVRVFASIGRHFADDKAVFPDAKPSATPKSAEQILYPTMFKE